MMSLERDHVLLYGSKVRREDGLRIRNKVLQPCGCWAAEVWRARMTYNATTREFEDGTVFEWHPQTGQCRTHAAKVAILQWELATRIAERRALETKQDPAAARDAFVAKLGDGARRLYDDRARVLAEAEALDRELLARTDPSTKQLPEKKKR